MPEMSNIKLKEALEELFQKLVDNHIMKPEDKAQAVEMVQNALIKAYNNSVPEELFTDPVKRKYLFFSLMSAPLMKTHPELKFDLALFFQAKLEPEKIKTLFKTFLTKMNNLTPNPKSEKEIDEEAEAYLKIIEQETQKKLKAGESSRLIDNQPTRDALDEVFRILFGITRFGARFILTINKGNTGGYIDSSPAYTAEGGAIHEGRDLPGDSTTSPDIISAAEERLLSIGAQALDVMEKGGLIHPYKSPSLKSK